MVSCIKEREEGMPLLLPHTHTCMQSHADREELADEKREREACAERKGEEERSKTRD